MLAGVGVLLLQLIGRDPLGSGAPNTAQADPGYYPNRMPVIVGESTEEAAPSLVVVEAENGTLLALDAQAGELAVVADATVDGRRELEVPPAVSRPAQFSDLEFSESGTLLISDLANGEVWQYTPEGRFAGSFVAEASSDEPALLRPTAIARDPDGSLLVADVGDHRIKVFNKLGELQASFGGNGVAPGRLSFPNDVAVGPDGLVYVADSNNRRVQVFEKDSGKLVRVISQTEAATGLAMPRSLCFDSQGRLHVADAFQERVSVFDADGVFLFSYGHLGEPDERLSLPQRVVAVGDQMVVSDMGNARLTFYEE